MSSSTSRNGSWQYSSSNSYTYQWWDGAMQSGITYTQSGAPTYTTTLFYDGVGTLAFAYIGDGRPRRVYYRAHTDGQIIHRGEEDNLSGGDPHETWYRFGGHLGGCRTSAGPSGSWP